MQSRDLIECAYLLEYQRPDHHLWLQNKHFFPDQGIHLTFKTVWEL